MGRLNPRKLRYLLQQKQKGVSSLQVAKDLGISKRRVNQVWKEYQADPDGYELKRPGRPPKPYTETELRAIVEARAKLKMGSLALETYLRRQGIKIGHNRIHTVLKEMNVAEENPKKQKRRKWVRWERDHSNDLWHADWTQLADGTWLLVYQDDASRFVLSWGVFPAISKEKSIFLLDQAIERYGPPEQVLTDKGGVFWANEQTGKRPGKSDYTKHLEQLGIQHIVARTNHPQTNGKVERLFGTIKPASTKHFDGDLAATFDWYNQIRPHMSLNFERAETPQEAYHRKLPPEVVLANTSPWFWK